MMSYRILVAACLFPAVACAGPIGVDGVHGISVFSSPTGVTISGQVPGGAQSVSVGPGPGFASAIASSFGAFGALSSTGAAVLSAPSGTVSGAFGIGTNTSANSNAGN